MGECMAEKIKNNTIVLLLLLTGAVYFFLKYITPLIAPIMAAMLFVTIFGPTLKRINEKFHINRQLGAVILLLAAGVIIMLLLLILFTWIAGNFQGWLYNLQALWGDISELIHKACVFAEKTLGVDSVNLENNIFSSKTFSGMFDGTVKYVRPVAGIAAFLVSFVIASILLAKDYDEIMNRMLDREECHLFLEIICGIIRYIATYIKAQLIIMSIISATAAVVLGLSGIKHGVMWGLSAGLFDVLPFVGTGIILIPLAVTQIFAGKYAKAVICVALYGACALVREMLEPRLIGRKIGVTPILVLISVYAGIKLFGGWGIIKGPLGFIIIYQSYLSITHKGILG
jgi:predicted PurR-regulated permease PerM